MSRGKVLNNYAPEPEAKSPDLPENWKELSRSEQKTWLIRNYGDFYREGEWYGVSDFAPDSVKQAFQEWMKDDDYYVRMDGK